MTKKNTDNKGNAKSVEKVIQNAEIEYPVTYELKAVMNTSVSDDENKEKLSALLIEHGIVNKYIGNKKSSKGTYVSYNYEVTLNSKVQMENLYASLKELPGLKFAL